VSVDAPTGVDTDEVRKRHTTSWDMNGLAYCTFCTGYDEVAAACDAIRLADELDKYREAIAIDADRLRVVADRAGITYVGCDTPDALADELDEARKEVDRLEYRVRALINGEQEVENEKKIARLQEQERNSASAILKLEAENAEQREALRTPVGNVTMVGEPSEILQVLSVTERNGALEIRVARAALALGKPPGATGNEGEIG
jgi:hypothetical protein